MLNYLDEVDIENPSFAELYDELPLWSAPKSLAARARSR